MNAVRLLWFVAFDCDFVRALSVTLTPSNGRKRRSDGSNSLSLSTEIGRSLISGTISGDSGRKVVRVTRSRKGARERGVVKPVFNVYNCKNGRNSVGDGDNNDGEGNVVMVPIKGCGGWAARDNNGGKGSDNSDGDRCGCDGNGGGCIHGGGGANNDGSGNSGGSGDGYGCNVGGGNNSGSNGSGGVRG
ncbi:trihydrophobin-like [Pyrus x bretschneideri]|uniref:trihydrophobin-like n=1 Tax=Pyrus x bretschneideri TaxID=225117 RepID=UPI00202E169A|nr:trihydrophobin-like [Pyrus x bretschneideri]